MSISLGNRRNSSRKLVLLNDANNLIRQFFDRYGGAMLVLLLAVFMVCGRLGHDFITTWDDDAYLLGNPAIRGFTPENLRLAFSRFYVGNYAPVQLLDSLLCCNPICAIVD